MTSRSTTVLAVAAVVVGVAAGACAAAGARSPDGSISLPAACSQALTVGHVPGYLDGVWQLGCTGETTDSGHTNRHAPQASTTPHPGRPQLGADCRPTVILIGRLPGRMSNALVLRCETTSDTSTSAPSHPTTPANRPR